jgi:hypothetical protein
LGALLAEFWRIYDRSFAMRGSVMTQAIEEAVFRVRAAGSDHWVVYRDKAEEPVASFGDKASALAYALHLAHRSAIQGSPLLHGSPARWPRSS